MGRTVAQIGVGIVVVGLAMMALERFHIRLGRLPGDIVYEGEKGSFYFPVVTCLLISAVGTLVMWVLRKF